METKHTKREWYIGARKTTIYSLGESSLKISVECDDEAEQKASIKLIAAAPDLLEALIKLEQSMKETHRMIGSSEADLERLEIVRNAINKATT